MSKQKNKSVLSASLTWPERIVQVFLFAMLGIFPLYYQNKYYNMGDAKYLFFKTVTLGTLTLLAAVLLVHNIPFSKSKRIKPKRSVLDLAVLTYTTAAVLSWILSPFRAETWTGSNEWYMGLFSQLLFTGIYFSVSRFCPKRKGPLWAMGISAAAVFLIAYLHRFSVDPLGLYEGLSDNNRLLFLGTIGQSSWYSSYVAVVLPVMMGVYLAELPGNIFTAAVLFLGFCSAVTQNSDSIYVGLGLAFAFLLWFAMEKLHLWKKYVELCLIAVAAAKFTGLLQTIFPKRVPDLDRLSLAITQGTGGWLILAVLTVVYLLTCRTLRGKTGLSAPAKRPSPLIFRIRIVLFAAMGIGLLSLPLLMWLISTGKIAVETGIFSGDGYLVFDGWNWGNGRGRTWSYCAHIFAEYPPLMKLFGCGPDSLAFYSKAWHAEEIQAMWGNRTLTNAHNEWLTALINYGVIGSAAYLSVFAAAIARICRHSRKLPILPAAGAAVLSYAGHNFFCYQQAVCTPLIFIVIGAAEYLIRNQKQ